MTSQTKPRLAPWGWHAQNGNSGLHRRPAGSLPSASQAEHDAITTPVPTAALLQAAGVMSEPEPPADLGLYSHPPEEQGVEPDAPPDSSSRARSGSLAADYGLEHLLAEDARPLRHGGAWGWLRSYGLWLVAGMLLLWLNASFLLRWLATLP
jgi:hypothetical protein